MKKLEYKRLNDDKLLHRYFTAQNNGGYFLKQEIPQLHQELMKRNLI